MAISRPTGATVLASCLCAYGAIGTSVNVVAAVLRRGEPDLGFLILGAVVSAMAGLAGLALWYLSPRARPLFLLWVAGLAIFNFMMLRPMVQAKPDTWPFFVAIGLLAAAALALLYRYVHRTCRAA
jgi:hypothetical protein